MFRLLNFHFYCRALPGVAFPLGHAAGGDTQTHVHQGLKDDFVTRFRAWRMDGCLSSPIYRGVHEEIDGLDYGAVFAEAPVDVVEAVGVSLAVLEKEVVHFWTAAGE